MIDDFRPAPAPKLVPEEAPKPTPVPKPTFQTPEQVAVHQEIPSPRIEETPEQAMVFDRLAKREKPRGSGHHWFNLPWPPTRTEIIAVIGVLLIAVAGVTSYIMLKPDKPAKQVAVTKPVKKEAPKPTTVASSLTGLQVAKEINERPVVGVMIENSLEARPQSGLSQAGVVFEAVAEGGITRFLALFQDEQPGSIGPIRSSRPYYVQWALGFQAIYAHVGGSPDALNLIKTTGTQDLDQYYNGGSFQRVNTKAAPHNVYANVATLAGAGTAKGYKSAYSGFVRVPTAPKAKAVASPQTATDTAKPATGIDFNMSGYAFNPRYDYDSASKTYKRSLAGAAHLDANTNQQLAPRVVVAIVVPMTPGSLDAQGVAYSNYNPIGTGTAYVFQNGTVTVGNWTKASNDAQLVFTAADGKPLPLEAGQTWISAVTSPGNVSYK
ncbi:DUF3048 domain-containing protein [Candidatus Saccharibacteria bacterium]|nr:DUF3048 domain-containing protein [Candidatus Saccharibacteria bacterium]